MRRLLGILLPALLVPNALAWNATGHEVIASIAWKQLNPAVKAQIEKLLDFNEASLGKFYEAAVWADDTRSSANGPWHYIDLYFRKDGKSTNLVPDKENVVWAIDRFSGILADKSKPAATRAEALKYLLHFVGDIHQPLHCVALVSDQFPQGDRGGNLYAVEPRTGAGRRPHNLHYLWDDGGGLFPRIDRPLSAEGVKEVDRIASSLSPGPQGAFRAVTRVTDPMKWAIEGQALAKSVVYATPDGQTPTGDYIKSVQATTRIRAMTAGARLAFLLNRLLASSR
jgi:hypothetical protein